MRIKCVLFCISAFAALAAAGSARAAEPSSRTIFMDEYQRGRETLKAKDWSKGYELFAALWEKSKTFDVAINLGQAELMLGKYREAAEHLAFGIRNAPPTAGESADAAEGGLAKAKRAIGTIHISAPAGSEVSVNDSPIGMAPLVSEIFVEPGTVRLSAKHPSQGSGELTADLAAGEEKSLEIHLAATAPKISNAPPKPPYTSEALNDSRGLFNQPPQPTTNDGIPTKTIVLIAGGVVTLAAAGTATIFAVKFKSAQDDAKDLTRQAEAEFGSHRCSSADAQGSSVCAKIRGKLDDHDSAARVFNIMLPVAGVAAVATGVLYLVWPSRSTSTAQKNLTLVPIATQQSGGFMLRGSF